MSAPPASSHADVNSIRPTATMRPTPPTTTSTPLQMHSQKKGASKNAATAGPVGSNVPQKKVPRRSSKPIINWFQRKLAGSGKGKRAENVPLRIAELGVARNNSSTGRQMNRITSSPLPVQSHYLKQQARPDAASLARRKTRSISLYGDEELREINQYHDDDTASLDQYSLNRDSIWSPTSALEADDDASVRPIPPSAPPSPSPSRSSSSYLSDPRTFRSMAASTKPTTLLSIDLNGNGMAHIAQAPTPPQQINRFAPHVRQSSSLSNAALLSSGASITFSALPSTQPPSRPTSNPGSLGSSILNTPQGPMQNSQMSSVQAPLHTNHHPRNNPRPSSPPMDNASVFTLASSAFGIMPNRLTTQTYTPSAIGDSVSHYGGSITFLDAESTSHYAPEDDERLEERDFDASVRALRPRSSRRGSWESEVSGWSARVTGPGTPSLLRERSLRTSESVQTGNLSTENGDTYDNTDYQNQDNSESNADTTEGNTRADTPVEQIGIKVESPPALLVGTVKEDEQYFPRASSDTIDQAAITPPIAVLGAPDNHTCSN